MLKRLVTKPGYRYVAVMLVILGAYHYAGKEEIKYEIPKMTYADIQDINKERLEKYFERNGSNAPKQMAEAVIYSRRPHIQAAQAVIESNARPNAIGKAKEKGAFQVIEKDWGKVSKNPKKQAEQNEEILDELLEEHQGNMSKALKAYNGRGQKASRYAQKVKREAEYVLLAELL